jgi:large subunit ribosomal protein L30
MSMYAVIRLRGYVKVPHDKLKAFEALNLDRVNHLVLVPEDDYTKGQIKKVQDYVTFGQVDAVTLERLLIKRARLAGDKRLDADFLKKAKFPSTKELAAALLEGKTSLTALGIKKVFRLKPPSKGLERKGLKATFKVGGSLGERGEKINLLIKKMA